MRETRARFVIAASDYVSAVADHTEFRNVSRVDVSMDRSVDLVMRHHARLAQELGADLFCIGCEMVRADAQEAPRAPPSSSIKG